MRLAEGEYMRSGASTTAVVEGRPHREEPIVLHPALLPITKAFGSSRSGPPERAASRLSVLQTF